MSMDDLLFVQVIGGIGLSLAYLRAEYLSHRRLTAARRRRESVMRKLHMAKARLDPIDIARHQRIDHSRIQTSSLPSNAGFDPTSRVSLHNLPTNRSF
jgi:hypothetical protein